mgnify:CR=1 FL=1
MEETKISVPEQRYKELIEKEVQLEILEKELEKDRNTLLDVNKLADILGLHLKGKDEN